MSTQIRIGAAGGFGGINAGSPTSQRSFDQDPRVRVKKVVSVGYQFPPGFVSPVPVIVLGVKNLFPMNLDGRPSGQLPWMLNPAPV